MWRHQPAAIPGMLWMFCWMNDVSAHPQRLSRHLMLEDLSMVVLLADAIQTPGPFAEQDNDYVTDTNDLTAAGRAGSPGIIGGDRLSVVNGVPLSLNITIYDVSNPRFGGVELPNVEVFLWHTDAAGVYSAVGDNRQESENTAGQVWCRGFQSSNYQGMARFETILPGWYPGRAIHYHLRLRFSGQLQFAATTQFYIGDDDLQRYRSVAPYSANPHPVTPLNVDNIFNRLNNPAIQEMLTLSLDGSARTGFSSSIDLGIVPPEGYTLLPSTETSTLASITMGPTISPTVQFTPAPEPVPKPTFSSASPLFDTAPPPTEALNVSTVSEQPTAVTTASPGPTELPEGGVVSTAGRRNFIVWIAVGLLGIYLPLCLKL